MTFEIDEEKIETAIKEKKANDDKISDQNFYVFLCIIGFILVFALGIFIGGGLIGIIMFGWQQL